MNNIMNIQVYRVMPDAILPTKGTSNSAAWDLYSVHDVSIEPGEIEIISTGLVIRPPQGYHIKIIPRSSFGSKKGINLPHCVGLIDEDYCGPNDVIKVPIYRLVGNTIIDMESEFHKIGAATGQNCPIQLPKGTRIAQMLVEKTDSRDFEIRELSQAPSQQNRGGFGSTGMK